VQFRELPPEVYAGSFKSEDLDVPSVRGLPDADLPDDTLIIPQVGLANHDMYCMLRIAGLWLVGPTRAIAFCT
jgi:hypothetical protein